MGQGQTPSNNLSPSLLPCVAPLSQTVFKYVLSNGYRSIPEEDRPPFADFVQHSLQDIARYRTSIFEFMEPYVQVAKQTKNARKIISEKWVLKTLAPYTPAGGTNKSYSIEGWVKRGILERHGNRGPLEWTSIAALLIARLFDRHRQKLWLPEFGIPSREPRLWIWAKSNPTADPVSIPYPLAETLPASTLLFSMWRGMIWLDDGWRVQGDITARFAGTFTSLVDVRVWDEQLAREIEAMQAHPFFGRTRIQQEMLAEAGSLLIERVAPLLPCSRL